MQAKGLFLNYKKNRRLMQYFFKIRAGIIPSLTVIFGKTPQKGLFYRLYTECWGVLKSILPTFFLL